VIRDLEVRPEISRAEVRRPFEVGVRQTDLALATSGTASIGVRQNVGETVGLIVCLVDAPAGTTHASAVFGTVDKDDRTGRTLRIEVLPLAHLMHCPY
jgi:hypothetical protein